MHALENGVEAIVEGPLFWRNTTAMRRCPVEDVILPLAAFILE
jgi:hypothetical protein